MEYSLRKHSFSLGTEWRGLLTTPSVATVHSQHEANNRLCSFVVCSSPEKQAVYIPCAEFSASCASSRLIFPAVLHVMLMSKLYRNTKWNRKVKLSER